MLRRKPRREVVGSHGSPPPGALAKATPPPEVEVDEEPLSEVMVVPPPPGPELEDEAPPKDCALQSNTPARPSGIPHQLTLDESCRPGDTTSLALLRQFCHTS
jgi:hypothetical protein